MGNTTKLDEQQQRKLGKTKKMLEEGKSVEEIAIRLGIAMSEVRGYKRIISKAETNPNKE